jgi:serine/threonine protein kinase
MVGGRYRITGVLGEGGVAIVLAASDERLGQPVAVKALRPGFRATDELREHFLLEGRALAALRGRGVATVFDTDVLPGGIPYVVLEQLTGHDLQQEIRTRGRVPWQEAVRHVDEACATMSVAHGLGILHLDIKPSNLFLCRDGGACSIKVLDFGLARFIGAPPPHFGESTVIGTPSYMAPEQFRDMSQTDARSDVWSLAVTLFELITGERPFDDSSLTATAAAVLASPARALPRPGLPLPPGLVQIVHQCLSKDAAHRPHSAHELRLLLRPYTGAVPRCDSSVTGLLPEVAHATSSDTYGGMLPVLDTARAA